MIDGKPETFSAFPSASYLDNPRMRLGAEDKRARATRWVRSIILHTTVGDEPQLVRPGAGPAGMASRTLSAWETDKRHAGSHLLVDGDGSVWCVADLVRDATYHAQSINEVSIGVELCQTPKLEIWQAQLDTTVALLDALTWRFGIQRQYHGPYLGSSWAVPRLARGGADCVGIFGHRDQTTDRGKGDPGSAIFLALKQSGYEPLNFALDEDLAVWRTRQSALGVSPDGIPGPATVAALAAHGKPGGMFVPRPGAAPNSA